MTKMSDTKEELQRARSQFPPPEGVMESLRRRRDRKRRNQRITAGVVGIAVFVAAVWIVTGSRLTDHAPTLGGAQTGPSLTGPTMVGPDDAGSIGLPSEGAAASTPENGELVASLDARPGAGFPYAVHQVWVYADGRVISRTEGGPYGANGVATGYLEQRLTPDGVQLLLSELRSTGLFETDGHFVSPVGLRWGLIHVRNGDRLVGVTWGGPSPGMNPEIDLNPEQARDLIRISNGLADPVSWLPADAWQQREVTAYVPSWYAICYEQELDIGNPSLKLARVLDVLPPRAQDLLLRAAENVSPVWGDVRHEPCSEVNTRGARTLERIFTRAGLERVADFPVPLVLTYRAQAPEPLDAVLVSFEPILPHGQWSDMGG